MDKKYFEENKIKYRLELISQLEGDIKEKPYDIDSMFQLAELYQNNTDYANAVNVYLEILKIDKDNKQAQVRCENAMTILSMTQVDIYSSPNTHLDPWE